MRNQKFFEIGALLALAIAGVTAFAPKASADGWVGGSVMLPTGGQNASGVGLDAKIKVVDLTDQLSIAARGHINTATEIGAAATFDFTPSDKVTLFAGGGIVHRLSDNRTGIITTELHQTSPTVNLGGEYKIDKSSGVFIEGVVPTNGDGTVVKLGYTRSF